MLNLFKKAFWLLRSRPTEVYAVARQYALFARTRVLGRFLLGGGVELAPNVRVQRLACLGAERPAARIAIGADGIVYEHARIRAYGQGRITIGESSIIGDARIYSRSEITIGRRVVTSWNVFIQDFDPHPIDPEQRAAQMLGMTWGFRPGRRAGATPPPRLDWSFPADAVTIGDDVWLGANVSVLKGAHIGAGSVVATGSVVTAGEYPPRAILAGVPARVVKILPSERTGVSVAAALSALATGEGGA